MISLNPAELTNSPKLRAVKLNRGQDGKHTFTKITLPFLDTQ